MGRVVIVAALCLAACESPRTGAQQSLERMERKQALDHATADCAKQGKKPASAAEAPDAPVAGTIRFSSGAEASWRCV